MINEKQIGVCGVDSGQILLCDPCYIDSEWKKEDFDDKKKSKNYFSYNACCKKTLTKNLAGQLNFKLGHAGAGVVVSSGYGDGVYPVYATYEDGRIKSVRIEFF